MKIKTNLQALRTAAESLLPDVLMVCGAVSVSAGAGMVYPPAGWIVGGVMSIHAGLVLARGGK